MPVLISVTRIAAANLSRKQQNDYLVERLKIPNKRRSKTSFKLLPSKSKKHSYLERVGTKADMMKQYYQSWNFAQSDNPNIQSKIQNTAC